MMMGIHSTVASVLLLLWLSSEVRGQDGCPKICKCETIPPREGKKGVPGGSKGKKGITGVRVECDGSTKLTSLTDLRVDTLPENTLHLVLKYNSLSYLKINSFPGRHMLQKLDLSHNQISWIEPGAFRGLSNLTRLYLNNNKIQEVNWTTFEGMTKLIRISLSNNELTTIPNGTFNNTPVLKRVDFGSSHLVCDCNLKWVKRWTLKTGAEVRRTRCAKPKELKDKDVSEIKRKELNCNWPVELDHFELSPSSSQIVFEGDKLPFKCTASAPDKHTKIVWIRKGLPVHANKSAGILSADRRSPDGSKLIQSLVLQHLTIEDSGKWTCLVQTGRGNITKSVNIIVLDEDTVYCRVTVTKTNRGKFTWPKTVSNIRIELPCKTGKALGYSGKSPAHAYHSCNQHGEWEDLNVSQCQYVSQVTRVLEQYTKLYDKNGTSGTLNEKAGELKKYISTKGQLRNKEDIKFMAEIIENYVESATNNTGLADTTIELVSIVMEAEHEVLAAAHKEFKACSRIVQAVEKIPSRLLGSGEAVGIYSKNFALEARHVKVLSFQGVNCTTFKPKDQMPSTKIGYFAKNVRCDWEPKYNSSKQAREPEAEIKIPASALSGIPCNKPYCSTGTSYRVQVLAYRNAKLFPIIHLGGQTVTSYVSGPVMAGQIIDMKTENLTDPVQISLVSYDPGINKRGVYWEMHANDGYGEWRTQGCDMVKEEGNMSYFKCNHMTNFAVLQDLVSTDSENIPWYRVLSVMFSMKPVVYMGSANLLLCMLGLIITYTSCHRSIKVPKKQKHSLVNLCISITFLVLSFILGIHRTNHQRVCQAAGIAIHYFSLCSMFWITITTSNMYKKFTKGDRPPPPPPDLLQGPLPPRPMLRYYLLGWGISIIICGITAAVNLNHYVNKKYCFLAWEPTLGALIGPIGFLCLVNFILFICIACVLRGATPPSEDPETEEIDETDITNQELESVAQTNQDNASTTSSVFDLEYRPVSQLRALAVVLFLYLITWTSAAFAVAKPFINYIPGHFQEILFSYSYGIMASVLGLFMLVFYCLARMDARTKWRNFCCCEKHEQYDVNSTTVLPQANGHLVQSTGSLDSSYTNKSNNTNRSSNYRYGPRKTSNVNLVPSQTASVTDTSVACSSIREYPSFYNPRQNGVAKKYWEKNRQLRQLKMLNREHGHSDTSSAVDSHAHSDGRNRRSFGNSSAENASMNVNEIDQRKLPNGRPLSGELPPGYSSLGRSGSRLSPVAVSPPMIPLSPLGQPNSQYLPGLQPNPHMVHGVPVNGYSSLSHPPPGFVYPTHMANHSSSTMPKVAKIQMLSNSSNTGSVTDSIPLVRELDGQSQVSQESRPPHSKKRLSGSSFTGHTRGRDSGSSRPTSPELENPYAVIHASTPTDQRCYNTMPSWDAQMLGRVQEEVSVDPFVEQITQRIPPANRQGSTTSPTDSFPHQGYPHSPSDHGGSQSDSSAKAHRKSKNPEHRGRTSSKLSRPHSQNGYNGDIPRQYALANQNYPDKMVQKLTNHNPELHSDLDDSEDPAAKELLPHSSSEHVHLANGNDSCSDMSGDESVWVLQQAREKNKKETSV